MRVVILTLALFALGCPVESVTVEPPPCEGDFACEVLNRHERRDERACTRWQCEEASARCVLRALRDDDEDGEASASCGGADCDDAVAARGPSADDVCNGVDDDCDLVVDEGLDVGVVLPLRGAAQGSLARVELSGAPATVRVGEGDGVIASPGLDVSTLGFARGIVGEDGFEHGEGRTDGCPRPVVTPIDSGVGTTVNDFDDCGSSAGCDDGLACNGIETCASDGLCVPSSLAVCERGAYCDEARDVCVGIARAACTWSEATFAPADTEHAFAATILRDGCSDGQVRVGLLARDVNGSPEAPFHVAFLGDVRRAPGYLGVDVPDTSARCTGDSRPEGAAQGAYGIGVASLAPDHTRRRPQALAAWLADTALRARAACGLAPRVPVEGIVAWHEETRELAGAYDFVSTSGSGVPTRLGETTQTTPVSLFALDGDEAAYVAVVADDGALRVLVVRAPSDPAETALVFPFLAELALETDEARRTPPSPTVLRDVRVPIGDETIDDVQVVGRMREGAVVLDVAFVQGCGPSRRVRLERLEWADANGPIRHTTRFVTDLLPSDTPRIAWSGAAHIDDGREGVLALTFVEHAPVARRVLLKLDDDGDVWSRASTALLPGESGMVSLARFATDASGDVTLLRAIDSEALVAHAVVCTSVEVP